jgi:hypothetical protein
MNGVESIDLVETNGAMVVTNGVFLSLSTGKARYWVHEPVVLHVTLKNIDQQWVLAAGGPGGHIFAANNIYVMLPFSGLRTRETEYSGDPRNLPSGSSHTVNLQSDKEYSEDLQINRILDMTPSGDYRIFVRREVTFLNPERKMIVQTPAITIHITDNPLEDEQSKK